MKSIAPVCLIISSVSTALAAGTLEFSLRKQKHSQASALVQRDVNGTSESALITNFAGSLGTRYFLNLTVGTPPQPQSVLLDTGSSDTILLPSDASFCQGKEAKCPGGTYNTSASSTFRILSAGGIDATYGETGNDTGLVADIVTDVIQVGDIALTGAHFGVARQAAGSFLGNGGYAGIMGLAYAATEAVKAGQTLYPTFVDSLVGAGVIASRLFSLYLNEVDSFGSILFGGVDTEKYDGNLTTLNFFDGKINGERMVAAPFIRLDEVTITRDDGTKQRIVELSELKKQVLPDSGSAYWTVPADVYNKLVQATGATVLNGNALLSCSAVSNKTSLTLTLSGNGTNKAELEVPLSSFFVPAVLADGSGVAKMGKEEACMLVVKEAEPEAPLYIIGDPILRAGYWVYDLENGQISVAQARLSSTASNIAAVQAGPHGVMKATNQSYELSANQTVRVAGTATASVSYSFSTAADAVGQTSGPQSTLLSSAGVSLVHGVTADGVISFIGFLLISVACGAFML